jgi:hypothetical protein
VWLIVVAAGVGNLIIGTHFESLASGINASGYLPLYLMCECSLLCAYVSALFFGEQYLLLQRTRLYPIMPGVRFLYAAWSVGRRPVFLLFWGTGTLVVGIMCRPAASQIVVGALFFSCLIGAVCTVLLAGYLFCLHRGWPPEGAGLSLLGIGMSVMVGSALITHDSLVTYLPLIAWVADAIRDAGSGNWTGVGINGAFFLALFAGIGWTVRRYA